MLCVESGTRGIVAAVVEGEGGMLGGKQCVLRACVRAHERVREHVYTCVCVRVEWVSERLLLVGFYA